MQSVSNSTGLGQVTDGDGLGREGAGDPGDGQPLQSDSELDRSNGSNDSNGPPSEPPMSGPPTSRINRLVMGARSQMAIRGDGALLVSLDDAAGLDLRGREKVSFLVLTPEDVAFAFPLIGAAQEDIASRVLGRLPRSR